MIRPWLAFSAGVVALGVLAGAARLTEPAGAAGPAAPLAAAAARTRAVGATLVCPDLHTIPGVQSSRVVAAAAGAAGGVVRAGPPGAGPTTVLLRGSAAGGAAYRGPVSGPLVLRASGPLSGGLVAEQLSGAATSARRGWADVACTAPRARQWFVGPGTAVGEAPLITLVNPGSVPALASITVLTPAGVAATSGGQSIAVGPGASVRVPLAALAPGAAVTAVEVHTVTGRVAAAVHDLRTGGLVPLGTDWVPAQARPARVLHLPGLPAQAAGRPVARTLVLADPGSRDAVVSVQVTTPQGTFVPTGLSAVAVAAGTVRTVPLDTALHGLPGAVTLRASRPVVAGALLDAAGASDHEIAYLGPVPALAAPTPVAQDPVGPTVDSLLELSAPISAGTVTVTGAGAGGHGPLRLRVAVPAGHTVEVSLAHAGVAGGTVVVTPGPGSGLVYAARIIAQRDPHGPLLSALGLSAPPPLVTVPEVAAAPLSLP